MAKSFCISKQVIWEAYKRVKANKGSAGVDEESLTDFAENRNDNLYKIWNRMSSGTYFPPPVKRVTIPKRGGEMRLLGVPTVADRVAQMVVKMYLEPLVEPIFHRDSYGYRPGKSALDAVGKARERCWKYGWVIDLDIKGFFDNIDHNLMMDLVRKHTDSKWVILYVQRWLKAPVELPDGTLEQRTKGTPQGGVISPLLANLFLHYAFDKWMAGQFPTIPFERYADDVIVHCRSEQQARLIKRSIEERLKECGLEINPEKTRIVYCESGNRKGGYPDVSFDFLSYTFKPRRAKGRSGKIFKAFTPAVSKRARKSMSDVIRSWQLQKRSDLSLKEIAQWMNPIVRGWINYYGRYRGFEMVPICDQIIRKQIIWARRKYKKLRSYWKAKRWLMKIVKSDRHLFAHWRYCYVTSD